jgi:hypothetical protein
MDAYTKMNAEKFNLIEKALKTGLVAVDDWESSSNSDGTCDRSNLIGTALVALKEQAAEEPVAWMLLEEGMVAVDDFVDYEQVYLVKDLPSNFQKYLDHGRARPLFL